MLVEGKTIALVEDDPVMGESLVQSLTLEGAAVAWFSCGRTALEGIAQSLPDLVICDMRLPDTSGRQLFHKVAEKGEAPPFLFVTAFGDIDQAVMLMQEGASDYITKPFEMEKFLARVSSAVRPRARAVAEPVLGVSKSMRQLEALLTRVARVRSSTLITGETGVGKEVCARFLHQAGSPGTPFVAVNCAAIPADLLESEIFGHEQGAFTGAQRRHTGYAERAQGGTLFLDEIGELAPQLQAKLLRLIEDRAFHRVGGEKAVTFNARLVCATNADLDKLVQAKQFRADLLFRINVIPIEIPPLRLRPDDTPWLMDKFYAAFAQPDTTARGYSTLAEAAALAHSWPGNARELRNRVERALALSLGEWIMPADLFPEKRDQPNFHGSLKSLSHAKDAAQQQEIERALIANRWQIRKTALELGISRTTLWDKMRRFGLVKPKECIG